MTAPFEKPDRVVRFGGTAGAPTTGEFTEPPSGKKDEGWALDDEPPASFWNWLTYKSYEWFRWIDERAFDLASGVGIRIKAPVVDTSADDGGNLELLGADSGADADKNGGDVTIGSGDSTGAGSSTVVIQASSQGAAGVAARVKENYIRCDGDALMGATFRGGVIMDRPVVIVSPAGNDGPALTVGHSGDDHSLAILGDPTAPDASALTIVPADTDPSVAPETGDIYPNSVSGQFAHYSDSLGRFQNLDPVVEATKADGTAITSSSPTAFDQIYTIPGGTLRVGSVIKIKAWGIYSSVANPTLGMTWGVGGFDFGSVTITEHKINARTGVSAGWVFEGMAIMRSIGASAVANGYTDWGGAEWDPTGSFKDSAVDSAQITIADTGVDLDVDITVDWQTAGNSIQMQGFIVEVL